MYQENDLPYAKGSFVTTQESLRTYKSTINNLIVDIKKRSKEGYYELTYSEFIPKSFFEKLSKWLTRKGYEVEYKDKEWKDSEVKQYEVRLIKITIRWYKG